MPRRLERTRDDLNRFFAVLTRDSRRPRRYTSVRHALVSLLVAVLIVCPLGAWLGVSAVLAEPIRPDLGLDPFESPEAFNAVIARLRAERAATKTDDPAESVTNEDASVADADSEQTDSAGDVVVSNQPDDEDKGPAPLRKQLSPEMEKLRDRVRYTLRQQIGQDFGVKSSTATDVMYYCLAFGRKAGVGTTNSSRPVSGIGCLCYNYPFRGYQALTLVDDLPAGRVGYGQQAYPSQLFAVLAQARVSSKYGLRVGKTKATISHLVEYEKLTCRAGGDMGLKLVGLSHYVRSDETWTSRDGQTWSLDRVIQEEMDVPFLEAPCGGVNRLTGLSYALQRRALDDLPVDGGFLRAQKYLNVFHDHALKLQNTDGSWHPRFFRVRGASRDTAGSLRATGMILEWLAFSLPEDRLEDDRMVRSMEYVNRLLNSPRYSDNTPALPAREIAAVMHAVHALNLYDQRVFRPAEPPAEGEQVAERNGSPTSG